MTIRLNPNDYRSVKADEISKVRFKNISGSRAFAIWFDYRGRRVLYGLLNSGQYIDMDTFVTHPWVFEKSSTGDRLDANSSPTFFPESNRDGKKLVNITYPMFSLKERSLQVVRDSYVINSEYDLMELELPKPLDSELRFLLTKKYCAQLHNRESGGGDNNVNAMTHSCSFHSTEAANFARFRRNLVDLQ